MKGWPRPHRSHGHTSDLISLYPPSGLLRPMLEMRNKGECSKQGIQAGVQLSRNTRSLNDGTTREVASDCQGAFMPSSNFSSPYVTVGSNFELIFLKYDMHRPKQKSILLRPRGMGNQDSLCEETFCVETFQGKGKHMARLREGQVDRSTLGRYDVREHAKRHSADVAGFRVSHGSCSLASPCRGPPWKSVSSTHDLAIVVWIVLHRSYYFRTGQYPVRKNIYILYNTNSSSCHRRSRQPNTVTSRSAHLQTQASRRIPAS